ncbi:MAG: hypothetical protein HRU28_07360 [Rhizobiales bacterium]|nr:hypothetical protein [Hyphomicrobiales bacterium]
MSHSDISVGDVEATGHVMVGHGNRINSPEIKIVMPLNRKISTIIEVPSIAIQIDPFAVREVIELCHAEFDDGSYIHTVDLDTLIIPLEEKHKLNDMCPDFWDEVISPEFESKFSDFEAFLKKRENNDLLLKIESMARNINRELLAKRKKNIDVEFQEIIQDIGKAVLKSQYERLRTKQETIDFFFYYLYSQCLLGKKTALEKSKC